MVAFREEVALGALRVLVFARDPLVRLALSASLAGSPELSLVSPSAGGLPPHDLVLWDAQRIAEGLPPGSDGASPILALVEDFGSAQAVLALGVQGAIRREAQGPQVAAALHALAQGLSVIDPAFLPRRAPAKRGRGPLAPLTAREQQVLLLLAEGRSNKEIAERLSIRERTAKFHVNAILQKLSADRRTDAVVRAARLGLIAL